MTTARKELIGLLNQLGHAPMNTHNPSDGGCMECPWPLHELGPEEIADALITDGYSKQPVEITGEMVERGVEELTNEGWRPPTVPQTEPYEGYTKAVVRGVIEAALGETK